MPVQSAIAWYMAYLLGMREKQKPPLLEERGEGVCKGLLLQPLVQNKGRRAGETQLHAASCARGPYERLSP